MKKLLVGWPLVSVSPLVLLLAGFSSAPLSVYASTEIDVTSVTNRYFADYDDYLDYVEWAKDQTYQIDQKVNQTQYDISDAQGQIGAARHNAVLALQSLGNITLDPDEDYYNWMRVQNTITRLQVITNQYEQAISELNANSAALNDIKLTASAVRSLLNTNLPTYQIVVDGYAGGGGCSCPDYTSILEQISARALLIYNQVNNHLGNIDDYTFVIGNMIYSFLEGGDLASSGSTGDEYPGAVFGTAVGSTVSNILASIEALNRYASSDAGLTYDNIVTTGPPAMQEIWNWILLPYAQLLLPNTDSHNTDNRMVNAIRDFYIEPTVWVTNSYTKPLWVNMMTNGIGGSAEHPILVELTSSGSHVSVDNPVWVQFTNSVYIDASSLSSITNFALDINWSPLFDLTNSVWMVAVVNSNELAGAIFDEEKRRVDDALDDETEQPTQETTSMPTVSLSFLGTVRSSYRDILTAYKGMFSSIPSEPPADIVLWQGGNYGEVEIRSIHWHPSDERTVLNHVRSLFSFAWYCLYVFVIFVTAAIDLCVCGVMVYMLYGLLLGDKQVAYNGMLWCFKTLASFFGYKPTSVK